MSRLGILAAATLVVCCQSIAMGDTFGTGANQFSIDFVPISGSTNPTGGYGIVNNDYRMGVHEITNDQWDKFKANLGVPVTGDPASAYEEVAYWTGADIPTNEVSWYEAAQFVNWLNTSTSHQAAYKFTGTQGTSGYALDIWSAGEAAGGTNLYRHKDAFYFLPTEDEWVKAAYWNGTTLQTYANASPDDLVGGEPDPAIWNYAPSAGNSPWNVGSGGTAELNGTYDMMGNMWEWMESPYSDPTYGAGSSRGMRGGGWGSHSSSLAASSRSSIYTPTYEGHNIGFRVASVPEPGSITLWVSGLLACLIWWRRRR